MRRRVPAPSRRDEIAIHHPTFGHGHARGRVEGGHIDCRFTGNRGRVFGGRWVPVPVDQLQRVIYEPFIPTEKP